MKLIKEKILEEYFNNLKKSNNNLVIDIDGVIATLVPDGNYSNASPMKKNINYINKLKKAGISIVLFTARGSMSGKNWKITTKNQLKEWGVLYDKWLFGKPSGDLYIDDKAATPTALSILARKVRN